MLVLELGDASTFPFSSSQNWWQAFFMHHSYGNSDEVQQRWIWEEAGTSTVPNFVKSVHCHCSTMILRWMSSAQLLSLEMVASRYLKDSTSSCTPFFQFSAMLDLMVFTMTFSQWSMRVCNSLLLPTMRPMPSAKRRLLSDLHSINWDLVVLCPGVYRKLFSPSRWRTLTFGRKKLAHLVIAEYQVPESIIQCLDGTNQTFLQIEQAQDIRYPLLPYSVKCLSRYGTDFYHAEGAFWFFIYWRSAQ